MLLYYHQIEFSSNFSASSSRIREATCVLRIWKFKQKLEKNPKKKRRTSSLLNNLSRCSSVLIICTWKIRYIGKSMKVQIIKNQSKIAKKDQWTINARTVITMLFSRDLSPVVGSAIEFALARGLWDLDVIGPLTGVEPCCSRTASMLRTNALVRRWASTELGRFIW